MEKFVSESKIEQDENDFFSADPQSEPQEQVHYFKHV